MLANEKMRDEYIELMKSHIGKVLVRGRATKDQRGKYNKIKIGSVIKDENPKLFK